MRFFHRLLLGLVLFLLVCIASIALIVYKASFAYILKEAQDELSSFSGLVMITEASISLPGLILWLTQERSRSISKRTRDLRKTFWNLAFLVQVISFSPLLKRIPALEPQNFFIFLIILLRA
jgi:hypothetical protein